MWGRSKGAGSSGTARLASNASDARRRLLCAGLLSTALAPLSDGWAREAVLTPRSLDLDWHDEARNRAVPVRLYLPAVDSVTAPGPLVVFSHGIGGWRGNYSYLGRHWASQGVASLHLQHVGSDRNLWGGGLFTVVGRLREAARDTEAIDRVLDLRFALDRLLSHEGDVDGLSIDPRRIVAAGHSYGANTTLLASGARVQRGGRWLDFRDPRIEAAMVLSAPPFYGESDLPAILSEITVPTLHVTTTSDVIWIPGMHSGVEDRVAIFDAVPDHRKSLVMYHGGSHSIFTDRTGPGGPLLNQQIKAATADLTLAFIQQMLLAAPEALARWQCQWSPLVAHSMGMGPSAPG